MGLPQAWDFRATLAGPTGFPGDPANCDFNDGGVTASGTSSNGIPWSWTNLLGSLAARDRSGSVDPRVAGVCAVATGSSNPATFNVTLPSAGTYDITLALGDQANQQTINFDILDNGNVLFNVATNVNTGGPNNYLDATGTNRTSDTDWATNNAKKRLTFTTTSAGFRLNVPTVNSTCMAHLRIDAVAAISPFPAERGPLGSAKNKLRPLIGR